MNAPDGSRHRSDAAPVPDPGAMLEHAPLPERVALAARFALLVMSPYGTRPWRLSATGDTMELAALPGRRLAVADPDGRALFAACGAVLFTLRCALLRFGLSTEPLWLPGAGQPLSGSEPVPLVRLRVTESAACPPTERVMFDAIGLNHAWQGRFDPAAPSARLVDAIQAHARSEGAWLGVVDEPRGARRSAPSRSVPSGGGSPIGVSGRSSCTGSRSSGSSPAATRCCSPGSGDSASSSAPS